MEEYSREPCPYRIFDDIGSAYAMGLVGGSIFHSFNGFRNAATGQKVLGMMRERQETTNKAIVCASSVSTQHHLQKKRCASQRQVRMRGPLTGVQFAAWGGMFSTIDCTMVALRKKEDPINSIVSGGLTGALLAVRSGPKVMVGSAVLGAVILAMIEGVGLITARWMGTMLDPTAPQPELEDPANLPSKPTKNTNITSGVEPSANVAPFGIPAVNI